jgi:hypothetical protein
VTHSKKLEEVKQQIDFSLAKRKDSVRLDYNNLDENTLPEEVFGLMKNENLQQLQMSHSNYIFVPSKVFDVFQNLTALDLSDNKFLFTLPNAINKLRQLKTLNLVNCVNLVSLPMSLTDLKPVLTRLELFQCTALKFPPHAVAVKLGLAIHKEAQGNTKERVEKCLDYMRDPRTMLTWGKERSETKSGSEIKLEVTVPLSKQAWGEKYIEYHINVLYSFSKQWQIRRRYTQMKAFYKQAQSLFNGLKLATKDKFPPFPKGRFESHTTDQAVCRERALQFQAILQFLAKPEFHDTFCKQQLFRSFLEIDQNVKAE